MKKIGNLYWAAEILQTIANAITTEGAYGNKTTSGSGRIAVVQSWGFFIGNTFNDRKYRPVFISRANRERDQLEFQTPVDDVPVQLFANSSLGWIPFGMLHDLIDTTEPAVTGVVDNVSGYTISGIFRGFSANSTTVPTLRDQILGNNGNSQAAQVNQLVTSYRW